VEENMLSLMNIEIGDRITLTPGDDLSDALSQNTYTVVGTVRSPVYLAVERGTSTLGSGTVKAYLYLPREAFTLDYYTAAYVRVSGAAEMTAFYSDYDDYIDAVIDELEPFGDARSQLRHDDLVDEATEKLDDAQKELDELPTPAQLKERYPDTSRWDARLKAALHKRRPVLKRVLVAALTLVILTLGALAVSADFRKAVYTMIQKFLPIEMQLTYQVDGEPLERLPAG
jgi:putative ABC transport system permease protein